MDNFQAINSFAHAHRYLGYAILFLGMIVEGELFLITFGILTQFKAFDFGDVFFIAYFGVLFSDILWYQLGFILRSRSTTENGFLRRSEEKAKKLFPYFKEKPAKALFISKFVAGTNHATMVLAGFLKMDFRRFLKLQIIISFVWTSFFLILGFLFGFAAVGFSRRLEEFILMVAVLLILTKLISEFLKYTIQRDE